MSGSYDDFERSDFQGRDLRLYSFQREDKMYYYNTGDRDINYASISWLSTPIMDDGIKQKGEQVLDTLTITVPLYNPIALAFRGTAPSSPIKVMIRQLQYGHTEAPLIWTGFVSSVKFKDGISSEILCNSEVAYLNRNGLRLTYQRSCPHQLYDQECGLNPDQWVESAYVRTLTGNSFQFDLVNANPNAYIGRFTNGFIRWNPDPDYHERRAIQLHNSDVIILLNNTDGMGVGMRIDIYPGCLRTPANCKLFGNIDNYGGYPMMPGVSPFDGNPVF